MADRYLTFSDTAPGRFLTRRLGLPRPVALRRFTGPGATLDGPLLHLTAGGPADGGPGAPLTEVLAGTGLAVRDGRAGEAGEPSGTTTAAGPAAAVVLDARGVRDVAGLAEVHAALHPVVRSVAESGRVVLIGAPLDPADHHQCAAQQALEGLVRSLGKELGGGRTAVLVRLGSAGARAAESTLRFLLSPRSAYVSGQVIEVGGDAPEGVPGTAEGGAGAADEADPQRPLAGRTALVTGAARGIGEAIAATLARDGARVVCLDVPASGDDLAAVADRLGGTALPLDITAHDAGERIADALPDGGLDVLVQNAGITRDRRLANMPAERWSAVLDVNLAAVLRTTDALLGSGALRRGGRVVATSSMSGIAGNTGQTNYAASKAGVIGLVRGLAPRARAEHGVTVNAVAPGFIETRMTAAMPFFLREAGRRMNSLGQGGLPEDVAETVAWLAQPASWAVNGQVVRVCGQSLLGA